MKQIWWQFFLSQSVNGGSLYSIPTQKGLSWNNPVPSNTSPVKQYCIRSILCPESRKTITICTVLLVANHRNRYKPYSLWRVEAEGGVFERDDQFEHFQNVLLWK